MSTVLMVVSRIRCIIIVVVFVSLIINALCTLCHYWHIDGSDYLVFNDAYSYKTTLCKCVKYFPESEKDNFLTITKVLTIIPCKISWITGMILNLIVDYFADQAWSLLCKKVHLVQSANLRNSWNPFLIYLYCLRLYLLIPF